ncbi:MAG: DNA translocase FtsK [Acidobacteria bacterium]|nr:DNA translocase FtsK [Acidobacteriota bacterium]
MATKQRSKTARSTKSKRKSAPRTKKAAPSKATSTALKKTFGHRSAELLGVGACVFGLICGLSIYFEAAGPVGEIISSGSSWTIGLVRFVLPVALLLTGISLIRSDPKESDSVAQMVVGSVLLLLSVSALLHIAGGEPSIEEGSDALGEAGGALGLAIAAPLGALVGTAAAVVVLVAAVLISVTVLGRSSLRSATESTAAGFRPIGSAIAGGFRSLFSLLDEDGLTDDIIELDGADGPTLIVAGEVDTAVPFDQDDGESASETKPETEPTLVTPEPDELGATAPLKPARRTAEGPSNWKLPPLKLLHRVGRHDVDRKEVEERGRALERALAQHGVETRLVGMVVGPTVTRYELELGPGVKVARVTSLNKDIAYAMASPDVRILAPIPGRQAIGVEVPNETREVVAVGDLLASPESRRAEHPLEVPIGRDINGNTLMINLATLPHLLIAGATGAGKSSCINTLITSILMRTTPEQVRMILVDPKRVEMGQYERVPHLLTQPVTDAKKAANALAWAVREMERRYDLLSECGYRDISGYNTAFDRGELKAGLGETDEDGEPRQFSRLPFILIVVDELADLMMVAARDVEESICRIAQMARAVGIHLVIATQRPSVNVITGVIKANVPARLAFAVSSLADSRVILDQPGAERLVGKGDMLLLGPASNVAQRIQGAWVDEDEVRAVVKVWSDQAPRVIESPGVDLGGDGATQKTGATTTPLDGMSITDDQPRGGTSGHDDDDELFQQAMELVVSSQLGSTSMLQRKLRVGFARAGRIMDLLEERGIVGPSEGSKARSVLISPEEFQAR